MHITKESYALFEKRVGEMCEERKEEIIEMFKEVLGDPTKSEYKPEEWLRKKERVLEKTGEKTSQSMRDAAKRYYEKNKERVIAEKLKKYHEKKEGERPAREEAGKKEIADTERMIREVIDENEKEDKKEGSSSGVKEPLWKRPYNLASVQRYREKNKEKLREQARQRYQAKKERERPAKEEARRKEIEDADRMIREVMGERDDL